jgi:ADP-ribose pyrophosphatase YjhB (NUDIX family)
LNEEPMWLLWAKKLASIAQSGLTYSENRYDLERYHQVQNLSIEILSRYTEVDTKKIRDLFANENGYLTPKIDVRAAIFRDETLLLVREKIDGLWALPGGWADIDTSLRQTLEKESQEEAGADIRPRRIIAVLDRRNHNQPPFPYGVYKIFVECDYISGKFEDNIETDEIGWYTPENLPPLSTGRNTREQIEMCFTARQKKFHETIFD